MTEEGKIKGRQVRRDEEEEELEGVDEFKKNTCHSFHHDIPFRFYWEEILGLPPVDLNELTTGQIASIGTYLEVSH